VLHILGPLTAEVGRLSVADAAGAEDEACVTLVVADVDDGLRTSVVGWPDELAIEAHVVWCDAVRGQVAGE
jgi:hypothetical protein